MQTATLTATCRPQQTHFTHNQHSTSMQNLDNKQITNKLR